MDMPPEIMDYVGQLGPLAAVAVYFFRRLFSYEDAQKACKEEQTKLATRVAVLEAKQDSTTAILSDIRAELTSIQADIKLLLSREK